MFEAISCKRVEGMRTMISRKGHPWRKKRKERAERFACLPSAAQTWQMASVKAARRIVVVQRYLLVTEPGLLRFSIPAAVQFSFFHGTLIVY
jgi:hypothetical protein